MENKIIFLISGRARNGKGTVSNILKEEYEKRGFNVCEIQLMRTLKGYLKDYFNWDGKEETKPRKILQDIGTDIIREKMNKPYFHIDRLTEDIMVLSNFFDDFIIPDVRFPLEIEKIKEVYPDAVSVQIIRDNFLQLGAFSFIKLVYAI